MKPLQADYRLGDLCAASAVSRGGYHRGRHAAPCVRASKDAQLATHLRPSTPRVATPMADHGSCRRCVSKGSVARASALHG